MVFFGFVMLSRNKRITDCLKVGGSPVVPGAGAEVFAFLPKSKINIAAVVGNVRICQRGCCCPSLNNPIARGQTWCAPIGGLIAAFCVVEIIICVSISPRAGTDDEFAWRVVCPHVRQLVDVSEAIVGAVHVEMRDEWLNTGRC